MNLTYFMPTRIIMGKDCLYEQRALLAGLGKKALVVTGRNSARASGAWDDAVKTLEANGQSFVLYDQVMANPTDVCVYEAGALGRKEGCDFVLAIGGGSPMDAAKAAAALAVRDMPKEDFFGLAFTKVLPLAAIPTTAGTGSETTPYSVLVDTTEADGATPKAGGPAKRSAGSPLFFPRLAFLDAAYMTRLNRDTTVNTAIDALSHAVEGMLCARSSRLSDNLARDSIAMIMDTLDDLAAFPADPAVFPPDKREALLLASAIAGMVIAQTGTAVPHSMGYLFTINWNTDHGRANGLIMKSFVSLCREKERADPSIPPRIPRLCAALGMELETFFDKLETLLGKREKASEAELAAWGSLPMKNAANTYTRPGQEDIVRMFRESVG